MGNETTPILTGKGGIKLEKKLSYILSCPKCDDDIDVTVIKAGTHIQCKCGNITWRPDYNPPWWAKTKNFGISLFTSLIIGIISTYIIIKIFEKKEINNNSNTEVNTKDTLKIK